jgi:hypothetical protein
MLLMWNQQLSYRINKSLLLMLQCILFQPTSTHCSFEINYLLSSHLRQVFPQVVPRSEAGSLKFDKQFFSLLCMMHIFTFISKVAYYLAICTYYWADANFDLFPLVWDVTLFPDFSKERVAFILKNVRHVLKMKTTYSLKTCGAAYP